MSHSDDWKPFSSLHGFIRLILLVDWDPIGVFGLPGTLSQYDRYADKVFKMIVEQATRYDVMRYLAQVQAEQIEMGVPQGVLEDVVDKLFHVADTAS